MGKLYYTKDIKELFDNYFKERAAKVATNEWLEDEEIVDTIQELRNFKGYLDEIITRIEEMDRKYDELIDSCSREGKVKFNDP